MTIIKVGPPFQPSGTSWNHRGKKDIAQIFISSSQSRINSMYFAYVENEGDQIVLSTKIGCVGESSTSMETVTFGYPSEYITRVSGECGNGDGGTHLTRVTFYSNKGTYGPYGPSTPDVSGRVIEFNYQVGGRFYGFFGTYNTGGIESIGFYLKPAIKITASQMQDRLDAKIAEVKFEASCQDYLKQKQEHDDYSDRLNAKRAELIYKRNLKIYERLEPLADLFH